MYRQKILTLFVFITLAFLIVEARLWYLQVWLGGLNRMRSDEMRRSMETIGAPRGKILDRNGIVLAGISGAWYRVFIGLIILVAVVFNRFIDDKTRSKL